MSCDCDVTCLFIVTKRKRKRNSKEKKSRKIEKRKMLVSKHSITSLLSSANTWSFQLIVDTIYLGIEAGKVAESFREGTFLKRSLSIVILRAVSILESKLISSFSLSLEEDKAIVLGEIFLEAEKVETLLEEHLII